MASRPVPEFERLRALALAAGVDVVGVTAAEPWPDARARLEERKSAGLHGGMDFTYREPARSADPTRTLPGARSIVVGARSYRYRAPDPASTRPTARVGAFAWVDHYQPLREGLKEVARALKADGWRARVLVDDNALIDREAAYRAGIGWWGKNANVLVPGAGSWFVLGGVVTDAPVHETVAPTRPVPDGCGPCRRCLDGCPTGAIVAPGVVDARRCLSWLLQAEGDFPEEFREALGDRLYGCDDCQEVCPPNRRLGPAPAAPEGAVATVDLLDLLDASDDEILARHGRWYLPGRDPDQVRRNALVVLANVVACDPPEPGGEVDRACRAVLARYRGGADARLATHAAWAERRAFGPAHA